MSNIEIKVIPMGNPPLSTTAASTPLGQIQKVSITLQGIVQLCTDAELENARRKRHCLNRRRGPLPSHDMKNPADSTIPTEIPFRERYLVMDVTASDAHSRDTSIPWNEVTVGMVLQNDVCCDHAVMHAYHSRGEYQRKCRSASKKQRLRVDRVLDEEEERMCFLLDGCKSDVRLGLWNAETDFCVNSADGNKVLSTWYVRALSRDDKRSWMDALRIVTERKAQDVG